MKDFIPAAVGPAGVVDVLVLLGRAGDGLAVSFFAGSPPERAAYSTPASTSASSTAAATTHACTGGRRRADGVGGEGRGVADGGPGGGAEVSVLSTWVVSSSAAGAARKSRTCCIDQRCDGSLTMVASSRGASRPAPGSRGGSSL